MTLRDMPRDATANPSKPRVIPNDVDASLLGRIAFIGAAIALALAILAALNNRPMTAASAVVIGAVFAISLWFTRYQGITRRDINVALGVISGAICVIVLIAGSPTPSALVVVSVVPFIVASLGDKRSLIIWLTVNALIVVGVYFHAPYIAAHYSEPPPNPAIQHFLHIAVLSVFITAIAYLLMGRRHAILKALVIANEHLTHKRNDARTANEQKSRFLSRLSHELRTPLNAILGLAEVMSREREVRLTARQLERLQHIQTSGQRLLKIVEEVMQITDADERSPFMILLPVAVTPAITDAVNATSAQAIDRDVSILVDASAFAATEVLADRKALRRVLQELIGNAIDFNRTGGTITIRLSTANGQVHIGVTDTGVGIPDTSIASIFEPFGQLHRSKQNKAAGSLGLTKTKAIVEQMHGTIEVTSKVGDGSTFTITFPVYVAPNQHLSAARATINEPSVPDHLTAASSTALIAGERPNVLYVEDNALNQLVMQAMFSDLGVANLHICSTGEEGFQHAIQLRPDLVLLDIHLPDCNGNELLARMRAEPALATIVAIAVSADAVPAHISAAIEHGFDDYLTKPISIEALRVVLEQRLPVVRSTRK